MTTGASRQRLILFLCCLAQFMVVLDIAIVNVALPSIQADLGLRQSTLQWVVIAYGLLLGGFLLLGGRLGDLLGRRLIFLTGISLFTFASLVAGLAQSSEVLIIARGVQGFGAALVAPSALAILAVAFAEGHERNQALGIYGAIGGSSASVGVIASGLLTDGPGWRWIFFINIPVGILLVALAWKFLPIDHADTDLRHYDAAGATTVTAGLLLLVYGLNRGVDHGWTSASTLAIFAISAVLLIAFWYIESRSHAPLVPGSALRNRTLVAANLSGFCLFGAFFAYIFLGSLLMQQLLRYSPTRTGFGWLATSIVAFVAAAIAGAQLVSKVGVRKLIVAGMALMTISGLWLMRLPTGANYPTDLLPSLILAGIAIGLAAPSVQIGALSRVESEGVGLASGLVETMREIGGAVGIAAVATVLVSRTNDANQLADATAREVALFDGFQSAYIVITVLAALGVVAAWFAFPRTMQGLPTESIDEIQELVAAKSPA